MTTSPLATILMVAMISAKSVDDGKIADAPAANTSAAARPSTGSRKTPGGGVASNSPFSE